MDGAENFINVCTMAMVRNEKKGLSDAKQNGIAGAVIGKMQRTEYRILIM